MRFAFLAADTEEARAACKALAARYGAVPPPEADVIVALGGDGFMLETLHNTLDLATPIYGMNLGTVGFLLNSYRPDELVERASTAGLVNLYPLRMRATLTPDVPLLTRPTNSSMSLGLLPAASMTVGFGISVAMAGGLREGSSTSPAA